MIDEVNSYMRELKCFQGIHFDQDTYQIIMIKQAKCQNNLYLSILAQMMISRS